MVVSRFASANIVVIMEQRYAPAFANPVAEEKFTQDGYLVMPMLSPVEVEALKSLYLHVIPDQPSDFYSTAFLPDSPVRREVVAQLQTVLGPYLEDLMPDYAFVSRAFIAKRGGPDQPPLPLHQDYSYVDQAIHRAIHVWIPLLDVDEANGCLTVVPRSHALVNHTSAMVGNPSPYHPHRKVLDTECKVAVPAKAGTAIFFNQRLLHGSTSNSFEGLRIAVAGSLLPKGLRQRLYVVDENDPGVLDVLEVRDEFAVPLAPGRRLAKPYPDGVTQVGTVQYTPEILLSQKLETLKVRVPKQDQMTAMVPPSAASRQGLLSRWFGRNQSRGRVLPSA